MDMKAPVEIAPGVFKPLGECTKDDLLAAASLADANAVLHEATAAARRDQAEGN